MKKVLFLVVGIMLFSLCFVSAADNKIWFGRNESNHAQMIPVLLTATGVLRTDMNFSVADIWNTNIGQLTDANDTQFNNIANSLTIDVSWLDTLYAPIGSGNSSWNQSLADTLYFRLDGINNMKANANMGDFNLTNVSWGFLDRVGIGTTSPATLLEIAVPSGNEGILLDGSGTESAEFKIATGDGGFLKLSPNIFLRGYGISYFNGGNVGIGLNNPAQKLTLGGEAANELGFYSNSGDSGARNWALRTNTNVFGDFKILQSNAQGGDPTSAGTTAFYIDENRKVGLGGNTNPTEVLDVTGNVDISGNVLMGWERVFANDTSTDRVSVSCSAGKKILGISCECSGCGGATNSLIFSQFTGDSSGRCLYGGSVGTIKIQITCARMFD